MEALLAGIPGGPAVQIPCVPLPAFEPIPAAQVSMSAAEPPLSAPAPARMPEPSVISALDADVLQSRLLQIVSEKTGYPVDLLGLDLEMESGLGIDSIKRVEILSAMIDSTPGLPEINGKELARLRTLGEVIAHLKNSCGQITAEAVRAPATAEASAF